MSKNDFATYAENYKKFAELCKEAKKLGFLITDHISIEDIRNEYPNLSDKDARAVLNTIPLGDYDDAINRDVVNDIIYDAIEYLGLEDKIGDED